LHKLLFANIRSSIKAVGILATPQIPYCGSGKDDGRFE
jgi:hypothetical protein